jgi:hypothetical protein
MAETQRRDVVESQKRKAWAKAWVAQHATQTTVAKDVHEAVRAEFGLSFDSGHVNLLLRERFGRPNKGTAKPKGTRAPRRSLADANERLAYARANAKPGMNGRAIIRMVRDRFGKGISDVRAAVIRAEADRAIAVAEGKVKLLPAGNILPQHQVRHAAKEAKLAWARANVTPDMSVNQLYKATVKQFGGGANPRDLRPIIVEAGGHVRGWNGKGAAAKPAGPPRVPSHQDLAVVNRALEKAHPPVVSDQAHLPVRVESAMAKLAAEMKRAWMTRLALDLTEGTFEVEWSRRETGRLPRTQE